MIRIGSLFSGIGGLELGLDGLSAGMDRALPGGFPAAPGEEQHPWEAPRVAGKVANRAARLKALGNAVVPHVGREIGRFIIASEIL